MIPGYSKARGWTFRGHERMDRDALLNVLHKLASTGGDMTQNLK